jgi:hypothetical protein
MSYHHSKKLTIILFVSVVIVAVLSNTGMIVVDKTQQKTEIIK